MSAALDLRSKEEKDAELDKRIEALRKKNEALIKRYQEIEEDRKKAEQEGIAVTALRRARPPEAEPERRWVDKDLSVTVQVMLSPGDKRVVKDKKPSGTPKPGRGAAPRGSARAGLRPSGRSPRGEHPADPFWEGGDDAAAPGERGGRGRRSRGRGPAGPAMGSDAGPDRKSKEWEERRRQNIEKMNEEMAKIAEYERNQRGRRSSPKAGGSLDMTLSMTGRERAEYVRWKKEREQIDQERLARHRKPTGQWRREWDAEKSDSMFKDGSAAAPGLEASGGEENKRPPPKPPTFGEFLTPHRTQRRRKGRGRGHGAGTKPYSMHDNRWEEKEVPAPTEEAASRKAEEAPSGTLPDPPSSLSPEEDEDQWEDVSEEEEEEESGSSSPESSNEDEAPRSASPKAQRSPRTGQAAAPKLRVPPRSVAAAPDGGAGTPPSPFSPVEGHQPVTDWGEEMDLASPRSSLGDSPLSGPSVPKLRGASGETPGLSPVELVGPPRGAQSPAEPPQGEAARPNAEEETSEKHEEAAGSPAENGTQGAAAFPHQPDAEVTPGTVEITDFERVGSWWRMDFSMSNYTFNYSNWDDYSIYDLDGYEVPHSYRAVLALYALIFLLGVLGNGAVIWVIIFELRRTVNGVWFLNLSMADLLCCLALPFLALPLASDHHWPLGHFACKLLPSLTILNMFASVLLLMAISADRCALVMRPVWCQNHRTLGLARGACASAWFLAGLLTLPSFIFRTTRSDIFSEKTTCVLDYTAVGHHQHLTELVTAVTRFICGFLVPFVVITACYSLLLARVHSKGFARSQKAIKVILVVIISFFVCWLPYHVVGLILASTHPHSSLFKGALEADPIVAGIAYINSCINPIIYVVMGQDFKDKFRRSWRSVLRGVLSDDPTSTMGDSRMKTKSTMDDHSVSTTV
ncbi:coiled-coil domain-containing protein 9 isoform X4 [Calonectris borealis]|uniref:coiled-coil domain-containing protein 9 isoform X4 n=1 Tax=Calonectris borealis TaxID=1323832 RepID=UPI003F4BF606